ncbi:hypothetical protein C5C74_01040 [Rathayibacter sp. AY1E8]|nr:hypothetical protein C5C74_01040 [Rathayibacter sp. AY1E8]
MTAVSGLPPTLWSRTLDPVFVTVDAAMTEKSSTVPRSKAVAACAKTPAKSAAPTTARTTPVPIAPLLRFCR